MPLSTKLSEITQQIDALDSREVLQILIFCAELRQTRGCATSFDSIIFTDYGNVEGVDVYLRSDTADSEWDRRRVQMLDWQGEIFKRSDQENWDLALLEEKWQRWIDYGNSVGDFLQQQTADLKAF
jgi:hypothetical protein